MHAHASCLMPYTHTQPACTAKPPRWNSVLLHAMPVARSGCANAHGARGLQRTLVVVSVIYLFIYLRAISAKTEIISITSLVIFENSSDSSSGRRPDSKSDEFVIIFILST